MDTIGRNKKPFSFEMLQKLCELLCTKQEICWFFECDQATIEYRIEKEYGINFTEYWQEKSAITTASIRRAQIEKALKGDNVMLIWLGKQMLGQREKHELLLPDSPISLCYSIPEAIEHKK